MIVGLVGCTERVPPRPSPPPPDKARLFGDPVLVPSRAGEAARRELAAAGEIAATIAAADLVQGVHVDVEADGRVVVGGRLAPTADEDDVRDRIAAVVDGVLGPDDARTLVVALGRIPAAPVREPPALLLVLAAMGLGASAGIAIDRALRRRRALQRARRRNPRPPSATRTRA